MTRVLRSQFALWAATAAVGIAPTDQGHSPIHARIHVLMSLARSFARDVNEPLTDRGHTSPEISEKGIAEIHRRHDDLH